MHNSTDLIEISLALPIEVDAEQRVHNLIEAGFINVDKCPVNQQGLILSIEVGQNEKPSSKIEEVVSYLCKNMVDADIIDVAGEAIIREATSPDSPQTGHLAIFFDKVRQSALSYSECPVEAHK